MSNEKAPFVLLIASPVLLIRLGFRCVHSDGTVHGLNLKVKVRPKWLLFFLFFSIKCATCEYTSLEGSHDVCESD